MSIIGRDNGFRIKGKPVSHLSRKERKQIKLSKKYGVNQLEDLIIFHESNLITKSKYWRKLC